MWALANPYRVRLRFHATAPGGRQTMRVDVEVPVAFAGIPIGAIVAFAKSLPGCPELPVNFEECDGHVCVADDSPFLGVALPNLNGAGEDPQRFLRGAGASGAVGGEDEHVLSIDELAAHVHGIPYAHHSIAAGETDLEGLPGGLHQNSQGAGSDLPHENRPPFYEVVWVMRVY